MSDAFDFMSKRVVEEMIEVCKVADGMSEPFRSGAITAMEELYFRITNGQHFDWEEVKEQLAAGKQH